MARKMSGKSLVLCASDDLFSEQIVYLWEILPLATFREKQSDASFNIIFSISLLLEQLRKEL